MTDDDKYLPLFGRPVAPWHKWFAWYPVDTVDRGRVWLRVVNRRKVQKYLSLPGPTDQWFQYAVSL